VTVRSATWYEERDDLRLGAPVNASTRTATRWLTTASASLDSGHRDRPESIVGRPRGRPRPDVVRADADGCARRRSRASRAVIIGRFIGQVAASFRQMRLTTVVSSRPPGLGSGRAGHTVEALHRDHGVGFVLGDAVTAEVPDA
jgi:hypothetical protein